MPIDARVQTLTQEFRQVALAGTLPTVGGTSKLKRRVFLTSSQFAFTRS
jgi:hypothetical protein